ncbi:MAG: hypothetical protein IKI64_11170 [Clostridia bacterium]|nr:hypothetical protein [Clostridia bacterium]
MALFKRKKVVHLDPEGYAKKVRRIRIIVIALLAGILVGLGASYLIRKVIIPGREYSEAEAALNAGNIAEGIERLTLLGDYKDAAKRAADIAYERCGSDYDVLKTLEPGQKVQFGRYEQDGNPNNGPEPIVWWVMMRSDNRLYLLAESVLDHRSYNSSASATTWAECQMRSWLNGEFINEAFTENERLLIARSTVKAESNTISGIKGGADTVDRLFLMSLEELMRIARTGIGINVFGMYAYPTKRALANGVETADYGTASWWLRTPGLSQNSVTVCDPKGEPIYSKRANYEGIGVRPCLWLFTGENEG